MTATLNHFMMQALNNAWANSTLYKAILPMSDEDVAANRPSFFGSIIRTLNHINEVDSDYADALTAAGKGRQIFQRNDVKSVAALGALQADVDLELAMFCKDIQPDVLVSNCQIERKNGLVDERVDWVLLHLFQHQIHHRGQIHAMLSHAGIEPPQLDEFFLENGRIPSVKPYWS